MFFLSLHFLTLFLSFYCTLFDVTFWIARPLNWHRGRSNVLPWVHFAYRKLKMKHPLFRSISHSEFSSSCAFFTAFIGLKFRLRNGFSFGFIRSIQLFPQWKRKTMENDMVYSEAEALCTTWVHMCAKTIVLFNGFSRFVSCVSSFFGFFVRAVQSEWFPFLNENSFCALPIFFFSHSSRRWCKRI